MSTLRVGGLWSVLVLSVSLAAPAWGETVSATVDWVRRVPLGLPVSGVIKDIPVSSGQAVKEGDVLLKLDPRQFLARVAQSNAAAAAIAPDMAEARRELARAQELFDRTLLSEHELQIANNAAQRTAAQYRNARSLQRQVQLEFEASVLRAPFDGVVVAIPGDIGQALVAGLEVEPVVILAGNEVLLARALVGADLASRLRPGQTVALRSRQHAIQGAIRFISLEPEDIDGEAPVYGLDVQFPFDSPVRIGETVSVELP